MPITFPAHQAVVLPAKLWWPSRTDATALCIGAAAPDLGYPLLGIESHSLLGVVLFAVPLTLLACALVRWRAAEVVGANLPDAGPFRLHSYRVLGKRTPPVVTTLWCAVAGALSHVVIDAFTHADRWGSNWLDLNDPVLTLPIRGEVTGARVLQYAGHSIGTIVGVALFLHIGRHRLLDRWYGDAAVAAARSFEVTPRARAAFWATIGVGVLAGALVGQVTARSPFFSPMLGGAVGLLAAGCWRRCSAEVDAAEPPPTR